jgi:hypothetical protein
MERKVRQGGQERESGSNPNPLKLKAASKECLVDIVIDRRQMNRVAQIPESGTT